MKTFLLWWALTSLYNFALWLAYRKPAECKP
jgi:hypothetical protein